MERRATKEQLRASDPNTTLRGLARLAAAHNHHAPRHLLEEMLGAADLAVAQAAQRTLEQATTT